MRGLTPWFLVLLMAMAGCAQQQQASAPAAVVTQLPKTPEEGTTLVIQYLNAGNYAGLAALMDQTSQNVWKTDPNMFTSSWYQRVPKPIAKYEIQRVEPLPGGNVLWVITAIEMPGAIISETSLSLKWMQEPGGWRLIGWGHLPR